MMGAGALTRRPIPAQQETDMAKGQLRGNKEAKKPKKTKDVLVPVTSFIPAQKAIKPAKSPG
jgi:hypothetical protein